MEYKCIIKKEYGNETYLITLDEAQHNLLNWLLEHECFYDDITVTLIEDTDFTKIQNLLEERKD